MAVYKPPSREITDPKELPEGVVLPKGAFYHPEDGNIYKIMPPGTPGLPPIWNARTKRWNTNKNRAPIFKKKDPNNLFYRMQQTEEGRRLWALWTSKRFIPGQTAGRPHGSYNGYLRSQRNAHKAKAKAEAKEIVALMEKQGYEIPKKEFARESIETAVEIMRMTEISPKDKLAAARTVLEWTMAKPVAQSEVSIKKAEDFLSLVSLAEEEAREQG